MNPQPNPSMPERDAAPRSPGWVIDYSGSSSRCCKLDAAGERCPQEARYRCTWEEQGGTDETFVLRRTLRERAS